jgi:hypothetical protein
MNFCILHQHLYQADGFQIPPQTQMLQRKQCHDTTTNRRHSQVSQGKYFAFA